MPGVRGPGPARVRRPLAVAAVLLAIGWPVAGCAAGEDGDPGGVPASATGPATGGAPSDQSAARLRVGLGEWTIQTSADQVPAGELQVVVTNAGGTEHDLVVTGEAGTWRTEVLDPGEQQTLVVTARAGERLALACAQDGHFHDGVETGVRVTD